MGTLTLTPKPNTGVLTITGAIFGGFLNYNYNIIGPKPYSNF